MWRFIIARSSFFCRRLGGAVLLDRDIFSISSLFSLDIMESLMHVVAPDICCFFWAFFFVLLFIFFFFFFFFFCINV